MRLRKLHNAKEILESNLNYFIVDPYVLKGQWNKTFNNTNPIEIEIGMGKGQFIINNALNNENKNFIGIELNETICAKAIVKILKTQKPINNLKILNIDARKLNEIFPLNSIAKIYLNFSDPWPKKRHIKNRLTSPKFLDIYKNILIKDAMVEFKTDNDGLYLYSLEVLSERQDIKILYHTNDLYKNINEFNNQQNIPTEYEQKFLSQNKNINKIVFCFK